MNDALFFMIAFGDYDCQLARMTLTSLRLSGFAGDAVVFTSGDETFEQAQCVNVRRNPAVCLLENNSQLYHARGPDALDYCLMRMVIAAFVDLSRYQYLFYADTDVLFFQNPCAKWLDPDFVTIQPDCLTLWDNIRCVQHLFPVDQAKVPQAPGLCSGLYSLPRRHWKLLDDWRELYLRATPAERHTIGDQRFLNYVLWSKGYPVKYMNNVSTWKRTGAAWATHYWQHSHAAMQADYATYISPKAVPPPASGKFTVWWGS